MSNKYSPRLDVVCSCSSLLEVVEDLRVTRDGVGAGFTEMKNNSMLQQFPREVLILYSF